MAEGWKEAYFVSSLNLFIHDYEYKLGQGIFTDML